MDTLHDRLADLADFAPAGGAPPAELWARGRRAHRRGATALAAAVLLVGAVGVRVVDDGSKRFELPPTAGAVDIALPIDYPVGEDLPHLDAAPGRLAAIWVSPRRSAGSLEAVGLVAETGRFGVLPVKASFPSYEGGDTSLALSPGGRRIAYQSRDGEVTVRDLVSGADVRPAFDGFQPRSGFTWVDETHLVGHIADGSDVDGWVWVPGGAPERIDLRVYPGSPFLGSAAGVEPWFLTHEPFSSCSSPSVSENGMPWLCDELGVIGPQIVLTHWDGEVVALYRADAPFDRADRRPVVVTAGAPPVVTFATGLIGEALGADNGAT